MIETFRNEQARHRQQIDQQARQIADLQDEDVVIDGDRTLKLRSPNGTYWALAVDDTGVLSTVNMGTTL